MIPWQLNQERIPNRPTQLKGIKGIPPLLVQAASIGTSHLYWYKPPLLVRAASIGTSRLYWYEPPLLVQAAPIGKSRLYWLGGCLVSALSIPIGENGSIPLLTLTPIIITSMQLQTSKLPDYLSSTPPATLKHKYYIQNVLVSIPICKIINKKEWHWPPNMYKRYSEVFQFWIRFLMR